MQEIIVMIAEKWKIDWNIEWNASDWS